MPPPTTPHWIVSGTDAGTRLDKYLSQPNRAGSRSKAVAALERGKAFVNGGEVGTADASRRLREGDEVRLWVDRPGSAARRRGPYSAGDLHILHEDDVLIVVDKPAGLLSVPSERGAGGTSAYSLVEDHLRSVGKKRPLVVHRIDLDTSGLVIFAKNAGAQAFLKGQFRRREPQRVYHAVVYGRPEPSQGRWEDRLAWDAKAQIQKETHPHDPRGVDAISDYRVIEAFAEASLIEVRLQTGKRNQIRIQARLRGHTLVGEQRYVFGPDTLRPIAFNRQALHAHQLSFVHPTTGGPVTFEAPRPPDFEDLLGRLRRRK